MRESVSLRLGWDVLAYLIAPATPSFPLPQRDPMGMGYAGRNSETEPDSALAESLETLGHRRLLFA
jgi:hypothetical protein